MSPPTKPVRIEPIAFLSESTVVTEYEPDHTRQTAYQSEAELEKQFIQQLQSQAYEYLEISSESELIANLRRQLENLNRFSFSDPEWKRFFKTKIAGANDGMKEKTKRIQENHIQLLKRDDDTTKNIYLIEKKNIHKNTLQVINQYEAEGKRTHRYDVTILVNGLPLVHIELKRPGH